MDKRKLVAQIADRVGISQDGANKVLTAALDAIAETVATGEKVTLMGFGTFDARDRQSRNSRDPRTGQAIVVPAKRVPGFKAGKGFKDRVDGK